MTIKMTFGGLMEIMDARAIMYIHTEADGCIIASKRAFGIMADEEFMAKYSNWQVIGIEKTMATVQILIQEGK